MLPCSDVDEIADFWRALDFTVVLQQKRPNPYIALEGHGFPLHYYGLPGHVSDASHSTCGVVVDTQQLFDAWASGLRRRYGRLPMSGCPRITRPRARKNAGGALGFSLVDPAGNWIRVMRGGSGEPSADRAESPLQASLLNAVVLADSKGDPGRRRRRSCGVHSGEPTPRIPRCVTQRNSWLSWTAA